MDNLEKDNARQLAVKAGSPEAVPGKTATEQFSLNGEVARISATDEEGQHEAELAERLSLVEQELSELKAAANIAHTVTSRKTLPATTSQMLAKQGIGEGPVDARTLDTALAGLSLEQRIAVKTQLLRAGAIA